MLVLGCADIAEHVQACGRVRTDRDDGIPVTVTSPALEPPAR